MQKLIETFQDIRYLPVIAESVLPVFPIFRDFASLFTMLKDNKVTNEDIFVLLIIHCALQIVNGKSHVKREDAQTGELLLIKSNRIAIYEFISENASQDEIENVCNIVLKHLNDLLIEYYNFAGFLKAMAQFIGAISGKQHDVERINEVSLVLFKKKGNLLSFFFADKQHLERRLL